MTVFYLIMYVVALVCFLVAAFGGWEPRRVNLLALGLVFFTVPPLVQTAAVVIAGG